MGWLRGQRSHLAHDSMLHSYPDSLPPLGGQCDEMWNCSQFAFDDGSCAMGDRSLNVTGGLGAWEAASSQLILYLVADMANNTPYAVQFQVTNPKLVPKAEQGVLRVGARGADSLIVDKTILVPNDDRADMSLFLQSPSFTVRSIGQSMGYPGATNRLTLTLASNVLVSERMLYRMTIMGLVGASVPSGNMRLVDAQSGGGHNDSLRFKPSPSGPRGFGSWDNQLKRLTLLVASDLVPNKPYAFAFDVVNDPKGHNASSIFIGTNQVQCTPSSRSASVRVSFTVREVSGNRMDKCRIDLRSLEDGTPRPGGVWTGADMALPDGEWLIIVSQEGYHKSVVQALMTLTFDSIEMGWTLNEGTGCDPDSVQAAYQDCDWAPRPAGYELFLVPLDPTSAWFVLTWNRPSLKLALWLTVIGDTKSTPWDWVGCEPSESNVLEGGGVYAACPEGRIWGEGGESSIRLDSDLSRSFGQKVVRLSNVVPGEYHVYLNVDSPDQLFSGTEQATAYLPDGTSVDVFTSVRNNHGIWWDVGYFVKTADAMFFRYSFPPLSVLPSFHATSSRNSILSWYGGPHCKGTSARVGGLFTRGYLSQLMAWV